jgi:cell division protein FtsL
MSKEDIYKDGDEFSGDEKGKDAFGVPENYFGSFGSRLFKKIEAEDELKDCPLLASIGKANPFAVPKDYFELREEVLQYPFLRDLKAVRFETPVGYFDEVTASVLNKIEVSEETKIYTALASIEKQNVFAVPVNYFEEFAARIENKTKEARVISIFARVKTTYKVAMAAAVALIVTLSILYNQTTQIQNDNECHTLACISKKEILNSNYIQSVSEENIIEMIDIKTLSDSLSLKKNGKTQKIDADEVSEEVDVNTITDEL